MKQIGINQLTIPLPFWNDNVHCYLGKQRDGSWIIVDAGLNTDTTRQYWTNQFQSLNINPGLDVSKILITHHHPDHFGFSNYLQKLTHAPIYINEEEYDISSHTLTETDKIQFYKKKGMPVDLISELNNVNSDSEDRLKEIRFIKENDEFEIGDLTYRAIIMPGHSIKHTCFYNDDEKILITGDHLTREVTPYISYQGIGERNPLKTYIGTLKRMKEMDIKVVLPGHGPIYTDVQERIDEIIVYFTNQITNILNLTGQLTAYEIMLKLNPNVSTPFEKWVAIGEVNALLNYLVNESRIEYVNEKEKVIYIN